MHNMPQRLRVLVPRSAGRPAEDAASSACELTVAATRSQEDAVALIVATIRKELAARPRTLFVVGSYRIGKERAYLGAARAMGGWRVFCNADKRKARLCQNLHRVFQVQPPPCLRAEALCSRGKRRRQS